MGRTCGEPNELELTAAHGLLHRALQGLIHRDIKPRNIFLRKLDDSSPSMQVKLGDFGLATDVFADAPPTPTMPAKIGKFVNVAADVDEESEDGSSSGPGCAGSDDGERAEMTVAERAKQLEGLIVGQNTSDDDDDDGGGVGVGVGVAEARAAAEAEAAEAAEAAEVERAPIPVGGALPYASGEAGGGAGAATSPSKLRTPSRSSFTSGVGTTSYASPEQLAGPVYSERADIYRYVVHISVPRGSTRRNLSIASFSSMGSILFWNLILRACAVQLAVRPRVRRRVCWCRPHRATGHRGACGAARRGAARGSAGQGGAARRGVVRCGAVVV